MVRPFSCSLLGFSVTVIALAGLSAPVQADDLRIIAAGDSLTCGYVDQLPGSFSQIGITTEIVEVAQPGLTSGMFIGIDAYNHNTGNIRNFAADTLTENPDVILFMMGINDAGRSIHDSQAFQKFCTNMTSAIDQFTSATNSQGQSSLVIVANLIPRLDERADVVNPLIQNDFNPWIAQETSARGFVHVDMATLITSQDNWQDFYDDGVHLYGPLIDGVYQCEGFDVMADGFRDAVVAHTPEPATICLLTLGGPLLIRRRRTFTTVR